MLSSSSARHVATISLVAAVGCEESFLPLPELTWEGANLRFGTDIKEAEICEGTLPYMDGYVATLRSEMGLTSTDPVDFFLLADEFEAYDACHATDTALACTNRSSRVFSHVIPQEHELVHAVRSEVELAHVFFEEGLAVYWGDDASWWTEPKGDVIELIEKSSGGWLQGQEYTRAGYFLSYLVQEFGVEPFMDFSRSTAYESSFASAKKAFAASYGMEIEDVVADFASYPVCDFHSFRQPIHDCSQEPKAVISSCIQTEFVVNVDCADDTIGPRDGEIWQNVIIEVETAGFHHIRLKASPPSEADWARLSSCEGRCSSKDPGVLGAHAVTVQITEDSMFQAFELEAGRYLLRLTRPQDEPGEIRVELLGGC